MELGELVVRQSKGVLAIRCMLIALCAICCANSYSQISDPKNFEYFANHRILKLYRVDTNEKSKARFFNLAKVIFQDQSGVFWIGSLLGLYAYDENRNQWMDFNNGSNAKSFRYIKTVCQDRQGRIWLKSLGSEIRFFDGQKWHSYSELHSPISIPVDNSVTFTGKDGELWFVTEKGLITFDGKKWTSPIAPSEEFENAYARMAVIYRNRAEGIIRNPSLEMASNSQRIPMNPKHKDNLFLDIYSGLQGDDGSVWLGAKKAIIRFQLKKNTWKVYPLRELLEVRRLYQDRLNRIWLADEQGHLLVYDEKDDLWKLYDLAKYFPQIQPKQIMSIYQDKSGVIMIGTEEGLITFSEKENRWRIHTETAPEFPVFSITAITEDKIGRIWLSTGEGILVLKQ